MKVFEFGDLPIWIMTIICGWRHFFLCGALCSCGVRVRLAYPKKDGHQQGAVTTHKGWS